MQIPGAEWLAEESCLAWVEDAELVLEISKQTLRSACLQAGDWHRRGVAISSFSVAIPTAHFLQRDFTQTLLALLKEAGIPGSLLELGLTGSTIRANLDATGSVLGALSPSGVRFCVRGSGVASLPAPYLRSLPIQTLEVSCSERATTLPNSVGVVRALVSHGCRLGLIVRATDVRSNAQRLAVLEAGCDVLQGPCVAKAFSAGELEAARLFSKGLPTKRSTRPVAFLKREFCS